jgi:hypothetical protein
VNVTIANGVMPLLQETKPFFSYTGTVLVTLPALACVCVSICVSSPPRALAARCPYVPTRAVAAAVGPAAPPTSNFSNIGARHLDINWLVAPDLWDALTTTGYWCVVTAAGRLPRAA